MIQILNFGKNNDLKYYIVSESKGYRQLMEENGYNTSFDVGVKDFLKGYKLGKKTIDVEKLKFSIDQLKSLGQVHDETLMSQRVRNKIKELEELLENETSK